MAEGRPESEAGDAADVVAAAEAAVDDLEAAAGTLAERRAAAAERPDLDAAADAHETVASVLDRYEERATDWDDFEGYTEFREALVSAVEGLPEDTPHREAFEAVDDILVTGGVAETLSTDDFERAREVLEPAREAAELRDALAAARERYRATRSRAVERRDELRERIDRLERLRELGEADLDAPVERLREPVAAYDDAVRDAFATFRREAPAREVLAFVATTRAYPLVEFPRPPDRLREYLAEHEVGTEPVPTLLEYADFSRSKLAHYVDDPAAFKSAVATTRTYLAGLDADPLAVDWPPPPADRLRYRARELVAVVDRFAPDDVVARLHELRALARDDEYERLRRSAVARAELDERDRERLRSGAVERELRAARDALERVEAALEEH